MYWDNKALLELCLENGGDINETDDERGTLLHTVFDRNRIVDTDKAYEILVYLLEQGKYLSLVSTCRQCHHFLLAVSLIFLTLQ